MKLKAHGRVRIVAFADVSKLSIVLHYHICIKIYYALLQAEMDTIVEHLRVEREMYEKAQEEQKVNREHRMNAAALCIQTLFRGYKYDSLNYCYRQLMFTL